jgi:hypothetical protein
MQYMMLNEKKWQSRSGVIMDNQPSTIYLNASEAIARLESLFEASLSALRAAISQYIDNGTLPDAAARANGLFAYHCPPRAV